MFIGCSKLTSVTIGNSVTTIGVYAFYNCTALTSVTIAPGVTKITANAFDGCSSLKEISFKGTTSEWNAVTKEDGWKISSAITTVHCTDGDVTV